MADASPITDMIYNDPGFTGVNIAPDTVAILAAHDNIIGMKDTSGNIVQLAQLVRLTAGKGFDVLAGSANHFLPALAVGAQGGILALANIAPDECVQIQRLFQEAKMEEARELHLRMLPVNQAITAQMGVPGLKAAMEMRGYFGGEPRQPLLPLSDSARETLRQILQEAGLL